MSPRRGGSKNKSCSPSASSTAAWVRISNSRMSWSCVPRGLTPSFCEGGKLLWQFCDFRLVAVGSEIRVCVKTTWTKPTRDRLRNCHQQSPWSLQICGTNFSYVGSMSKVSPNLQQKPDLHCFDFQSSVPRKLSPVGCHLLRSYPNKLQWSLQQ